MENSRRSRCLSPPSKHNLTFLLQEDFDQFKNAFDTNDWLAKNLLNAQEKSFFKSFKTCRHFQDIEIENFLLSLSILAETNFEINCYKINLN